MANENKLEKKSAKKSETKSRFNLIKYLKDTVGEVKKLTWLTKNDLLSHVAAVLVFVIGMAILIYVLDLIFGTGMRWLQSL